MGVKSLLCCLFPGLRINCNEKHEAETVMECRRELMKKLCLLQVSRNYRLLKDRILGRITFDYSRIVIVSIHPRHFGRMAVLSKLRTYGDVTLMQERWSLTECGNRIWRGVIIEYSRKSDAEHASLDLPLHFRHLQSTMLEKVMRSLADCELLQPPNQQGMTKVVINRAAPLNVDEDADLHASLNAYGPVATFFINNRPSTLGAVCEVKYVYFTQAYLAMIMTHGFVFSRGPGVLTSAVEKSRRERQILSDAKESIILNYQSVFPI